MDQLRMLDLFSGVGGFSLAAEWAGIPNRVARLRAPGNIVVPQQAQPILAAIAAYERGTTV